MSENWTAPTDFKGWLNHVFNRPVAEKKWYHRQTTEETSWEPSNEDFVRYAAQAFEDPAEAFGRFTEAQVGQGLWYLLDSGFSNAMFALTDKDVAWPSRRRVVQAIGALFEKCFAARCTKTLSHLDEKPSGELNGVCYMWWDLMPIKGAPRDPERKDLDQEILMVMAKTLEIPHLACQEAALHGLGHWAGKYEHQVSAVVDAFIARRGDARPELLEYARKARAGAIL